MLGRLAGKVAVITGGNSGIGLATAKRFVAEGAYVYITGRRKVELDNAVKEFNGDRIIAVQGDVSNMQDLDRLYATVKTEHGTLDIIFANAGIYIPEFFGEIPEASFDVQFGINVKGLFFTVQKALPLMRDGGSIIVNSSSAGTRGYAAMSVYSATKAAVRSFARTWTVDLKKRNIRVNAISPSAIDTAIFGEGPELRKWAASQVPWGRMGTPDELASAALFLASADSSFVTGIELAVDGGMAQI